VGKTFFDELMKDYGTSEHTGKYPVSLGFTETGHEVLLDLKQLKHVLVSGMSQSGKSTMVRKLLPSLIKYADVAIYSTKDSDFIDYKGKAFTCSDMATMEGLVRRSVGEVERRNDNLRNAREKDGYGVQCEDKPLIILIDEFQSFSEMAGDAGMSALKRLIREGAGLNIFVYIITQTPTKKVLSDGLRDNIMTDIAFKQRDSYGSRMAIGNREAEFLELHQCIVRNVDKTFKVTRLDKQA
jgi:DNA segregation ATPase FtsK/SpoIIIE-like protein